MLAAQTTIVNRLGLHARPAMAFVEEASRFAAEITVRKCCDGETVDGKSILQMLMLAGTCGTVIEITADDALAQGFAPILRSPTALMKACPSKRSPASATKHAPRSSSRVSVVRLDGSAAGRLSTSPRVAITID